MRIALVHLRHRETGGTERYLQQMAAHLAAEGHEVTVVCRSHERRPHPAVRFMVLRDLALGNTWRLWAFARAVERHVRNAAYDVVFALGKTWTHDVVRLGGGCEQTYLEMAHRATLRPWERWLGKGRLQHRLARKIEARALAPGAYVRVITNSEMVRNDVMRRYGIPPDRVAVIYNGVDLERFQAQRHRVRAAELRSVCGFGPGDFVVLFLGTGYGRKGLARLLEAFPAMRRARPWARLLVVGYDSRAQVFVRRAARLGLGDRVCFLGGRRDAEVCYAAADLYVLPTYYDPFANSTLEALASGLPVITTESNGAREVLTHRVHGSVLRAGAGREELLAELLFWSDGDRARQVSQVARALAERYPESRTVRASSVILEEAATAQRHSPPLVRG